MPDPGMEPDLTTWMKSVDDRWIATGIGPADRTEFRQALETDMRDALAAGADTRSLTETHPNDFADDVARARGCHVQVPTRAHAEPSTRQVTLTALTGGVVGAAIVWFLVWPIILGSNWAAAASDGLMVAVAYPIGALAILVATGVALRWTFGPHHSKREAAPTILGMVAGILLALPATLALSHAMSYPNSPGLIILEALPLILFGGVGIVAARCATGRRAPTAT